MTATTLYRWVKRRVRRSLLSPLLRPLTDTVARSHRGLGTILMYHRISAPGDEGADWGNRSLAVDESDFESQVEYLSRHFRCMSLPECVRLLTSSKLPERVVVLTFDDGYRDNLERAVPVLEKYDVPATVYVATGLVEGSASLWWCELEDALNRLEELEIVLDGRTRRWPLATTRHRRRAFREIGAWGKSGDPAAFGALMQQLRQAVSSAGSTLQRSSQNVPEPSELMLSWDELDTLAAHPLVTIGAHTVTHPPLARLSAAEAERELRGSKQALEERLGQSVDHFAYPYGGPEHVGRRELELAASVGFKSAVTTAESHLCADHGRELHALPRLMVQYGDSLRDLDWRLSGLQAALHRLPLAPRRVGTPPSPSASPNRRGDDEPRSRGE